MKILLSPHSLCFLLLIFFGTSSTLSLAQSSSKPKGKLADYVKLEAGLGYAVYQDDVVPDIWYPVWVTVEALKYNLDGYVDIIQEDNQVQVRIPIDVAKKTKKLYKTSFKPIRPNNPRSYIEVTLHVRRYGEETAAITLKFLDPAIHQVLVFAEEPGAFGFLNRRGNPSDPMGAVIPDERKVTYGDIQLLPENPIELEPLSAIVLTTPQVRGITKEQWAALLAWVEFGGRLVLAAGKHQPFIVESNLNPAFGVSFSNPAPASMTGTLEIPAESGEGSAQAFVSWPELENQGAWDAVLLGTEDKPFLARRNVGRGQFFALAAAADKPILDAISARRDGEFIWASLFNHPSTDSTLRQIVDGGEPYMSEIMQRPFQSMFYGIRRIATFIILYLILVVPMNWYVCRKLKHREWSWLVAVALAIAFSWYGYTTGAANQQKAFRINEVTFVSRPEGIPQSRATTLSAIYSPRRFNAAFSAGERIFPSAMKDPAMSWGMNPQNGGLYDSRPFVVDFGASSNVQNFFVYPWSARGLRSDFITEIKGGIEVEQPLAPTGKSEEALTGVIRNNTSLTFKTWYIVSPVPPKLSRAPSPAMLDQRVWMGFGPLPADSSVDLSKASHLQWLHRGQIIGAEMTSDFLVPFSPDPRSYGYQAAYNPSVLGMGVDDGPSDKPGFQFFGIAIGGVSPLLASVNPDDHNGLLFYEEDLPTPIDKVVPGEVPDRWFARLQDRDAARLVRQNLAMYGQGFEGSTFVPLQIVNLELVPYYPFAIKPDRQLKIRFKLDTLYQRVEGNPIAGCAVSVFNFTKRAWEDSGIWLEDIHTMLPAEDYLNPATCAVSLRLDARRDHLSTFSDQDTSSSGGPFRADMIQGNYIRLTDLEVSIEPPNGATPKETNP